MSLNRSDRAGPPDKTATGTLTAAAQTVQLAVGGMNSAAITLAGTWVANVAMEVSSDGGTSWITTESFRPNSNEWNGGFAVINDSYFLNTIGAVTHVRARCSAYTSGTVNVAILASSMEALLGVTETADLNSGKRMVVTGGLDSTGFDATAFLTIVGGDPTSADVGLIVRNVPSGTQTTQDTSSVVDNSGFTDGANKVLLGGYIFDEVAGAALTENDAAAARIDAKRAQIGVIEDATTRGRVATVTAANALKTDGSAVTQPVSGTVTANQGTAGAAWETVGDVAADAAVPANPVAVGGRASTAVPTAVSTDGDSVYAWLNRSGAQVITQAPHVGLNSDPWNLVHEAAQYTTTQTSAVLVAGGASEKIVVTKVQIQVGGTTAGTLQLYFGTGAFARGTNRACFDGEFAPSATLKPGVVMDGPFIAGTNGDDLMVTTSAAINPLTINCWYYVIT